QRLHRLAPFGVGDADDRDVGNAGAAHDRAFDLGRIDILAPRHDHVLDPVVDEIEAVGIAIADIAGAQPAVNDRLPGRLRSVPILFHHDVAADRNLADLAVAERA